MEVFEGGSQALEQSGLTFVAVKVHPEFSRSAQQAPEGVNGGEHAADDNAVVCPIDLQLFTGTSFEASLDSLGRSLSNPGR